MPSLTPILMFFSLVALLLGGLSPVVVAPFFTRGLYDPGLNGPYKYPSLGATADGAVIYCAYTAR